jgi:hypothetical protein
LVEQLVKALDAGCGARHDRSWRHDVHTNTLWSEFRSYVLRRRMIVVGWADVIYYSPGTFKVEGR